MYVINVKTYKRKNINKVRLPSKFAGMSYTFVYFKYKLVCKSVCNVKVLIKLDCHPSLQVCFILLYTLFF